MLTRSALIIAWLVVMLMPSLLPSQEGEVQPVPPTSTRAEPGEVAKGPDGVPKGPDGVPGGPDGVPKGPDGDESAGDALKPLGPNLFPLYVHELRTADNTEIRQILGLYTRQSRPDGTGSTLLLPFFYSQHDVNPRDDRFYLFPLYYRRDSEEVDFHHLAPFYFSHRRGDAHFKFLVPFWLGFDSEAGKLREDHLLFPLIRSRSDRRDPNMPVTAVRAGLWKFLELYESRQTPRRTDTTALNFFNWGEEARSGISLYHSSWVDEPQGVHGKTRLFPFYWHGSSPGSDYRWIVPLFGYDVTGATEDYTLIPLLSRLGWGPGDARRVDLLFPLFHYARDDDRFSIASYPFFDYHTSPESTDLGIMLWLYRQSEDRVKQRSTKMMLYPLSYFSREKDERIGTNHFLIYLDTWNKERRHHLLFPLYYSREKLLEGRLESFFTWAFPTYFSFTRGSPDHYFSFGFPLFWRSHEGGRGWAVFFPVLWNFYSRISNDLHLIPLFSYRSTAYLKQFITLGPLYIHERFYDLEEKLEGTGHHFLWPFFKVENRRDGYDYRFLPFFWITRLAETSGMMLSPFYFEQTSPEGTSRYLFPFYAKFDSPRESRAVWAAGLKARHEVRRDDESISSETDHYAWWLATFENNYAQNSNHQRILPLLYWNTESPTLSRKIAGPAYYGHRIAQDGQVHNLDLFFGNLFLSKTVDTITPIAGGTEASEADADQAVERVSSDRGVLWPLSRWYERVDGSKGQWLLPFYANVESHSKKTTALFPLYFGQKDEGGYSPSYFRYFFLFDKENYSGGHRWSVAQLLLDYKYDEQGERSRYRFLYPLFEFEKSENSFDYQITPLISGSYELSGGERESRHTFFPIYWQGKRERLDSEGNWERESDHLMLFPLFGVERRSTRVDYRVLFPFFHVQTTPESLSAEFWPLVFYRDNPALNALRIWPLHSNEKGETAGDFWVSKYLFFSKYTQRENESSYRLDPFLFRYHKGEDRLGMATLFEMLAYDRSPDSVSFRVIPFAFGHATPESALSAFLPVHYNENFGDGALDDSLFPRIFFLSSSLRGAGGEHHFSLLTKFLETRSAESRPDYSEFRLLHRLVLHRTTETSKQIEYNPLFTYYRDDVEKTESFSLLLSLYRQETKPSGRVERTLFYIFRF